LSSVFNNLARTSTEKAERAFDVWDMPNHHSAVINLLKVNLLATSSKEFLTYHPRFEMLATPNPLRWLRAIDSPRL
jgi:hypothetical protein